jgi:hypothetical protein
MKPAVRKSAAPKSGTKAPGQASISVQLGPKREKDVVAPIRVSANLASSLSKLTDKDGVVHIPEAFIFDFIQDVKASQRNTVMTVQEEELRESNVMTQALAIIYGDREKTYGRPHINLESIAEMWTVYMRRIHAVRGTHDTITIEDVCQMMVLLKMARLINDPTHKDSLVDEIGYIGLHERVQVR